MRRGNRFHRGGHFGMRQRTHPIRFFDRVQQGGIYRSRKGLLFGVCRGFADYFNFSVFWVRAIAVILLIFTGFWPVGALYLVAALLMKPAPAIPIQTDDQQEFYDSYTNSKERATSRLKKKYDQLKRRIQRLEDIVTSPEYHWEERMGDERVD